VFSESLTIEKKDGGHGIPSFKHLAEKMSILKRNALRRSKCPDMTQVWLESRNWNVNTEELLASNDTVNAATKALESNSVTTGNSTSPKPQDTGCYI